MLEVLQTILLAAVMFVATNADDLLLLTIFFAHPNSRPLHIVLGQLSGIGALAAISCAAAMMALAVPHGWLPWIGVVPIAIGLRWLCRKQDGNDDAPAPASWWAVAGVTMANGGDNLGVYIPAFAIQTGVQRVITGAVFALLTLMWCWIAWSATRHPSWGPVISRLTKRVGPYVLIGIGAWIVLHHPLFGLGLAEPALF